MPKSILHTLLCCSIAVSGIGCSTRTPENVVVEQTVFPTVIASALSGEKVELPSSLAGNFAVVIVAYEQNSQFDVDRWALGLMQAQVGAPIVEVPTIAGFVPSVVSSLIDSGMRSGIPKEDWPSVMTVYSDADKIKAVLGDDGTNNSHVLVLDRAGRIIWKHNRGYSPRLALEIKELIARRS